MKVKPYSHTHPTTITLPPYAMLLLQLVQLLLLFGGRELALDRHLIEQVLTLLSKLGDNGDCMLRHFGNKAKQAKPKP